MVIDIIQQIKNHLGNTGNTAVPKIDPNTQEPVQQELHPDVESAAIPVVLVGFYKNTRNADEADKLIRNDDGETLKNLFKEHTEQVVNSVANYAKSNPEDARSAMERTVGAIKKSVTGKFKRS